MASRILSPRGRAAQFTGRRAMGDCLVIVPGYDGRVSRVALADIPRRKANLVAGRCTLPITQVGAGSVVISDLLVQCQNVTTYL